MISYRDGGLALQDPSQGITGQVWRARILNNTQILLSAPNYLEQVLQEGTAITDISIAFDQNMNLHYCWVDQGTTRLRWYDTTIGEMTTTSFGTGIVTPKLDMDDKRDFNTAGSDIIFAYVRSGALYYRQQRDRFETERLLDSGPWVGLERIGMGTGYRMQFECIPFESE